MEKDRKLLFAAWSCHNKNYYAYQTWNEPLRKIFQNVVSFDPQEQIYMHGKDEMNKKFLEIVEKEQPDYIFLWLIYEEFYIDTLLKIKEICPKAKIINYCGDDDVLFGTYSLFYSLIIDYFFVTHKEYIPYYKNRAFLSCATNTEAFKPLNLAKKFDVTFIGTPKGDRKDFVKYLVDNGIKIRIFGAGWENYPEFREIYGGFLKPEDYTKIINESKINLCFTKNYVGKTHVIQKFFEINACKSFELTEYSHRYAELFKDKKELVMFKTKEDLLNKIKCYLKNEKEREKIAELAYKRILKDFSKDVEFKRLFNMIFKDENKPAKQGLPEIKGKIAKLTRKDLILEDKILREKYKNFDYFSFQTEIGQCLRYKDYFQIYSLLHSKKPISCCDYYLYSDKLRDYMAVYANTAFKNLNEHDFSSILNLDQIVVVRDFFFNNIEKFRLFFAEKRIDIINEQNTSFVTMPLVRMKKILYLDYEKMKKVSWPKFENKIKSLRYQKKLIYSPYLYMIAKEYISGNKFMLDYLLEKVNSKFKIKNTISILKKTV